MSPTGPRTDAIRSNGRYCQPLRHTTALHPMPPILLLQRLRRWARWAGWRTVLGTALVLWTAQTLALHHPLGHALAVLEHPSFSRWAPDVALDGPHAHDGTRCEACDTLAALGHGLAQAHPPTLPPLQTEAPTAPVARTGVPARPPRAYRSRAPPAA